MPACLLVPALLAVVAPAGVFRGDRPEFRAFGTEDQQPVGSLVRFGTDGSATVDSVTGVVQVRDLVSLRRVGTALPPFPAGPVLITTSGDRIRGRVEGGDARSLQFRPAWSPDARWAVPLSSIAVLWLSRPPADTPAEVARYAWLGDASRKDLVLLRNGDLARGTLVGFTPSIRLKSETGPDRTFPITDNPDAGPVLGTPPAALAFDPSLARVPRPRGPFAHLVLQDGSRLDLVGATAGPDTIRGKTLFGMAVEIPLTEVVSLDVRQGKATYLSDLKPARIEQAGFLGTVWPWTADRNAHGEPLQLLTTQWEETFDKGLGTHPRTTLTYSLGGKYRRFETLVGLDCVSGRGGRADVRILVDGKLVSPPELRKLAAGPAVPVRVDLTGAKELTLIVDFGPTGDVQADVDWGNARLIGQNPTAGS